MKETQFKKTIIGIFVLVGVLVVMFSLFGISSAIGKTKPAKHAQTIGIVSSAVVTGLVYGPKIKNCAIINDLIMWEGESYTVDPKTRKIMIRIKHHRDIWKTNKLAPKVTLVKVSKFGVTLLYQESKKDIELYFYLKIKRRRG